MVLEKIGQQTLFIGGSTSATRSEAALSPLFRSLKLVVAAVGGPRPLRVGSREAEVSPLPFSLHRHALERRRRARMAVQVRQLHNDRLSGCSTSSSFNSGGTLRPHPPSRIGLARPACSAGASQR